MLSGSSSSSNAGWRNRRASTGSENPRCTSTLAAAVPISKAVDSVETAAPSGEDSTQRDDGLILGEIPAKRVAFVDFALGHGTSDFVFRDQEFLVPVGLKLVDVEAGIMVERQF